MNNKCPTCGAQYNITAAHVGRTFTCQRCQSPLVVQADGLHLAGVASSQTPGMPAQPPAAPQPGAGAYEDYGGGAVVNRSVRQGGQSHLMDFLMFRRMIVPIIIHVIFWIGVAGIVLMSLIMPLVMTQTVGAVAILLIPIFLVFGLLFWRIYCELVFLPFRINETLTDILNELKRG